MDPKVNIEYKSFKELTTNELYYLLKLRQEVFIVEQYCVFPDIDDIDLKAWHVLGWMENKLLAYARFYWNNDNENGDLMHLGRVAVCITQRNKGMGSTIVEGALAHIFGEHHPEVIRISAQAHLLPFYEKLGFKSIGTLYYEDGIPHIDMLLSSRDN